jgi:hypothetical protein
MGGHTAWRKRVAAGELAKGSGGAALRHRPRLGRKGADIKLLNRLGNLGGHGNPKRKKTKRNSNVNEQNETILSHAQLRPKAFSHRQYCGLHWTALLAVFILLIYVVVVFYKPSNPKVVTFSTVQFK